MRKRLIAAVTAVAVLSLGVGVAFAENIYTVHIASTSKGRGTMAKPLPVKLNFGYTVGDTEGLRPTVIKQYRIAPEGHITFPKAFPTCTFAQADSPGPGPAAKCRNAIVGGGLVRNHAGPADNRTIKTPCNLKLTLINISTGSDRATSRQIKKQGGMAIRLDGDPPLPADPTRDVGCPLNVHEALAAPFYRITLNGRPSSELRFTVPQELTEPLTNVFNSVIEARSVVNKRVARTRIKGETRRVGYYSKIACRKTGITRVTFVDEQGRQFTARKRVPGRC